MGYIERIIVYVYDNYIYIFIYIYKNINIYIYVNYIIKFKNIFIIYNSYYI